ncbi:MJ0042-type zinc finger domain-containing protein [Brevundimonas aurantiaca]|uniref:MJ0042-type zinc finger domain-containing protein n=1 Tax=Brevundimonas aurantiaca TaxID=74316 RepID=UPI00174AEF02|nr:MJ0042-type zinc finger domain-containing protein [Brevundimonas aurantiaca]
MILTCPACATSYFIPDDALGANGRKVRCKSCGEVWRASPDEPLELSVAPEPRVISTPEPEAVSEPASLAETPAPELPKAFRARAEQQRRLRRAATHGVVWAGLASVFVGLIVSAFLFRIEVVDAFPRAAAAYAAVGAPVNPVGLDFEAMSAKEVPSRPGMVLVSGALRNVRDTEIVAPPVRVALLDEHGAEIGFKLVTIAAAPVLPGKVRGFAVLTPAPGGHAADIGVNFVPVEAPPAAPNGHAPAPYGSPESHGDEGHGVEAHAEAHAPPAAAHAPADHAPAAASEGHAPADAHAELAPASNGLRSAVAPGMGERQPAPIEARPLATVDRAHGEAVSASHG